MITFFKKTESLLPAIPLLILIIEKTGFRGYTMDFHLHDTMYVIQRAHVFGVLLGLMIFYWLLHWFLRQNKWRNNTICGLHVYGTTIGLIIIYTYLLVLGMYGPSDTITSSVWKSRLPDAPFTLVTGISVLIFISLQVLFLLYFVIWTIWKALMPSGTNQK